MALENYDSDFPIYSNKRYNINGRPINSFKAISQDYINTGISAIDSLMTLIRGQSFLFFRNGLPHNELAVQCKTGKN